MYLTASRAGRDADEAGHLSGRSCLPESRRSGTLVTEEKHVRGDSPVISAGFSTERGGVHQRVTLGTRGHVDYNAVDWRRWIKPSWSLEWWRPTSWSLTNFWFILPLFVCEPCCVLLETVIHKYILQARVLYWTYVCTGLFNSLMMMINLILLPLGSSCHFQGCFILIITHPHDLNILNLLAASAMF